MMGQRIRKTLPLLAGVLCLALALPALAGKEDRDFIGAEAAYREGSYRKALSKLEDFVEAFPESRYRQQALFYAGECAIAIEKFTIARRYYETYLDEFPEGPSSLRAMHGRALSLAGEGRDVDAVAALLAVAPLLERTSDRADCYRKAAVIQRDRGRPLGVVESLGMLLDQGGNWREEDDLALREASDTLTEEELLSWEREVRGSGGGGLALFVVLERRGLTEVLETTDPVVFLFADEYPEHPFRSRIEVLRADALSYPTVPTKIGVILPLSGRYRQPGTAVLDGIQLAVDSFAGDFEPELVLRDSEGNPETAVAALEQLVTEEQVIAVVGPLASANAVEVAQRAEELRVPIIVLSQKEGVPETGRYVFRNFLTPSAQVDSVVDYAVSYQGMRSFAILYPATERGGAMAERFWQQATEAGGEVVAVQSYDPDETDYRKPLRRLYGKQYAKKGVAATDLELPYLTDREKPQLPGGSFLELVPGEDFQAVFVPDGFKRVSMIAPAMVYEDFNLADTYQSKMPVTLLGGAGLNHPDFVRRGERYVRGALFVDAFFVDSSEPGISGFVSHFEDVYERRPGFLEAFGYDSMGDLLGLLGDEINSRPSLRRALATSTPQESIVGSTGYDDRGEMQRDLLLLSVAEEAIDQVYPPPMPPELLPPEPGGDPVEPVPDGGENP